jgi:hydroxymethylbilane synthase
VRVRIGTRGSRLALWQTGHVQAQLAAAAPGAAFEQIIVRTTGDRITDVPLARIGDVGLFTRQLDRALLDGHIDLAVHSLKDVPTRLADGLRLAAILPRDDPRDALVPAPGAPHSLADIPAGALVGTSSLRRRALLLQERPDLHVADLRGNLDTRIERLGEGHYAAAILAYAGIRRLGRDDVVGELLDANHWLPAPGQGALAVVTRDEDGEVAAAVASLDDAATRAAVTAERTLLRTLEGGCQIPIGAYAVAADGSLQLHGFAADDESADFVRGSIAGPVTEAAELGHRLARELIDAGADAILQRVRRRADERGPAPAPSPP